MKLMFLPLLMNVFISFTYAQFPSDKIFTKYENQKGVENNSMTQAISDSLHKSNATMTLKIISLDKDDKYQKMLAKMTKDCDKLLTNKMYNVILKNKDDDGSKVIIVKLISDGKLEILIYQTEEDELTLSSTQVTGLSQQQMKDYKYEYKNH